MSEEGPSTSFESWDAIENFFKNDLNDSQVVVNDDATPNPTDDNSSTVSLPRDLLLALQSNNLQLKQELDDLRCCFENLRSCFDRCVKQTTADHIEHRIEMIDMLEVNSEFNKTYAESQVRNSEKKWRESMNAIVKEGIDRWSSLQTDQMKIKEDLANMDEIDANLKDRIKSLESKVADLDQYGRRPSIEISGVSEDISQSSLEAYVALEILHPIGVRVGYWDIVACHRLKKRDPNLPAPVVVRFVNRKHAVTAVKNRHKLKFHSHLKGIFITDNLCPYYRSIFDELSNLKQQGVVNQVWSYNGKVSFKSTPNRRARGTRVGHMDELNPPPLCSIGK